MQTSAEDILDAEDTSGSGRACLASGGSTPLYTHLDKAANPLGEYACNNTKVWCAKRIHRGGSKKDNEKGSVRGQ